jgi:hypothetical protein
MSAALLPVCCAALVSCARDRADAYEPVLRTDVPASAIASSFGELEDPAGLTTLSSVGVASLSQSGRYLAVTDARSAPFVRIVELATGTVHRFGGSGDGPGEMRAAGAVAFSGDTLLFVLSPARLERYSPRGEWLGGHRLADAGIRLSSITIGCGGRLFGYGLAAPRPAGGPVPWVHELHIDSVLTATPLVHIDGPSGSMSFGALYGFAATDSVLLLWHRPTETGYRVACDDDAPTVLGRLGPPAPPVPVGSSDAPGMAMTIPDTVFNGAAAAGRRLLWAWGWGWQRGREPVVELNERQGSTCRALELRGDWRVRSAHEQGLLLSTNDPHPVVHLVRWDWLDENLRRVPCAETGR